jgi:uncharacterized membrane protein
VRAVRRAPARAWIVPAVYAVAALATGVALPRIEHRLWFEAFSSISSSSAIAIYSTIASGTMTLSAIVFSLTFVMVQFGATAYSPRLALWLAEDPLISHALGIFTATFLYSIAALAWVDRNDLDGVPLLSAVIVVCLLLASIAAFIALVKRVAVLQVSRLLGFIGDQGRSVIAVLSTEAPSDAAPRAPQQAGVATQVIRHSDRPRTVQAIDTRLLLQLACDGDARIDVVAAVGDTVIESTPLVYVFGTGTDISGRRLRSAIHVGDQRTFAQDPQFAIRLLVDIAIRALSAAINDPTTAVQALDQIGDLLLRLGRTTLPDGAVRDASGTVRVVIPRATWDDVVRLALEEIAAYGASSVQVMRRMNALLSELTAALPPERRTALAYWRRRLEASITRHFPDIEERRDAGACDRQGLGMSRAGVSG